MNSGRPLCRTACQWIFVLLLLPFDGARVQCDTEAQMNLCLARMDANTHFLKAFKIEGQVDSEDYVEYSYVLTRNTLYHINLCTPADADEGVVITLYDSRRNFLVSNNATAGVFAFAFHCASTGIYYIRYSVESPRSKCGVSVLSFSRPDKITP